MQGRVVSVVVILSLLLLCVAVLEAGAADVAVSHETPLLNRDFANEAAATDQPPHSLAEERYSAELLYRYPVIAGANRPEDPPGIAGWNVLSELGTVTAWGGSYFVLRLDPAGRAVLVKLTPNPNGGYTPSPPANVDERWRAVRADSHHHLAIEVDREGYLHLTGDMHNYPVNRTAMDHLPPALANKAILYWRSTAPGDITSMELQGASPATAPQGTGFGYLRFFKDNQGELYLAGRLSMLPPAPGHEQRNRRGVGLTRYDCRSKTWQAIGALPQPSALAKVVLWERFQESDAVYDGYTKVIPWVSFDQHSTLYLSGALNDGRYGDYAGAPDRINHFATHIVCMRSKNRGASFTTCSGDRTITLPGRLEAGPQQAEIVHAADMVNHVVSVASVIAIDYQNQPVLAFHRQRIRPGEANRATYYWLRGGTWARYDRLGATGELADDFRMLLQGPDNDLVLVPAAPVSYLYRFWQPDSELRKVNLPFKPSYFNPNHFRATGELLGLGYEASGKPSVPGTVSVYRVTIELANP